MFTLISPPRKMRRMKYQIVATTAPAFILYCMHKQYLQNPT